MAGTDKQREAVTTTRAAFFMAQQAYEEAIKAGDEAARKTAEQAANKKAEQAAYTEALDYALKAARETGDEADLEAARETADEELFASDSRTEYVQTKAAYEAACAAAGVAVTFE